MIRMMRSIRWRLGNLALLLSVVVGADDTIMLL